MGFRYQTSILVNLMTYWRWLLVIWPVTPTNTDDKADYHIKEEVVCIQPTTQLLVTIVTIEDDNYIPWQVNDLR